MKPRILSKNNLVVSEVMQHIMGKDVAEYLSVVIKYSLKSTTKDEIFKVPTMRVEKEYQITRHRQSVAIDFLVKHDILIVEKGDMLSEGRKFKLDGRTIFALNYIISLFEDVNFRERIGKNMIREKFDIDKIIKKGEK